MHRYRPTSLSRHRPSARQYDGATTTTTTVVRDRAAVQAEFEEFAEGRDEGLRAKLIEGHIGLAAHLARRFTHRGEQYDDLVQVASVGLIKSVDRFDPARGVDFVAYATKTIVGELKRHFRDKAWAVRAPRRVQELYLNLGHAEVALAQELQRTPTVPELVAETGASEKDVVEALGAGQAYRSTSLEDVCPEDESVPPCLGEEDERFASAELRVVLSPHLDTLDERDRAILRLRFAEGLTQSEIAECLGLSQMHVSRLLARSLVVLRAGCEGAFSEDVPA